MSGMLQVMGKVRIMMQESKSLSSLRYEWKMWHLLHSLFLREIIVFIKIFMIYKLNDVTMCWYKCAEFIFNYINFDT